MAREFTREEKLIIAAEKVRRKEEEEKRKEKEYYERITNGTPWLLFKLVAGFCTLMMILTTIDVLVDGETKKLTENEWKIDRQLYAIGYQSVKVEGYLFVPPLRNWLGHIDDSFEITYSPIFRTGKWLSYDQEVGESHVIRQETIRVRSIFTWFPYLQIVMLIPLLTVIFKAQKPMFNFARVASLILILPGIILVTVLTLL